VRDGRLELSKSDATAGPRIEIAGDLQISSSANSTTEVRLNRDNLTADDATVSVRQPGKAVRPVVSLNGFSDTIGALNLVGGLVDTGFGSAVLTLNGDVTARAAELGTGFVSAAIFGTLGLGPTRTITVNGSRGALVVFAPVTGGTLIKEGTGDPADYGWLCLVVEQTLAESGNSGVGQSLVR
jgi:hypothetical protein